MGRWTFGAICPLLFEARDRDFTPVPLFFANLSALSCYNINIICTFAAEWRKNLSQIK